MSVGFHFQFLENKIKYCIIAFRVFLGRSQYSPQGPNTSSTLLPDSNSHRIPRRSVAKGPTSSQGHIATSQILSCSTPTVITDEQSNRSDVPCSSNQTQQLF